MRRRAATLINKHETLPEVDAAFARRWFVRSFISACQAWLHGYASAAQGR